MRANLTFLKKSNEFWACVKLLNQRLGYVRRASKANPTQNPVIPTILEIKNTFYKEKLDYSHIIDPEDNLTAFGNDLINYFNYRSNALLSIKDLLLNKDQAEKIFYDLYNANKDNLSCHLPLNKQTGDKKNFAFLTGIVNILINLTMLETKNQNPCDYDPRELTLIVHNNKPIRVLSRRVDGAYPSIKNPQAIWEIKEYYNTTTFGSRVSDGVYETQLDGWELSEIKDSLGIDIEHYLITDDYFTWWIKGKSYLCRIIDSLHMGLLTEALFGKEVLDRIPKIVKDWK